MTKNVMNLTTGTLTVEEYTAEEIIAISLSQPTVEQLAIIERNKVLEDLISNDKASIRSIREYLSSLPDAPQILKDKETLAISIRSKLV